MTKLCHLCLSHSSIGFDGAAVFAGGLHLAKLKYFNLSHNNMDMAAAKAVLTSLKKCEHLYNLTINESNDWSNADNVIHGLVSPDDTATISELVEAA